MNREYIELGTFEMVSDVMRVSDPCYDKDVWCCGTIKDCKTGVWDGMIATQDEGEWGDPVVMVAAIHDSSTVNESVLSQIRSTDLDEETGGYRIAFPKDWEDCDFEVGVDSGQAGLFDDLLYGKDEQFDGCAAPREDFGSLFYSYCCDITLSKVSAGVIPNGVVSSSGYGDGGYSAFLHRGTDGKVDAVAILFI